MNRVEMIIVGLLLVGWVPGLLAMSEVWNTVEYASHSYLVPWVALWAATAHHETLASLDKAPPSGALLVLAVLALAYVGALAFGDASLLGLLRRFGPSEVDAT